MGRSFRLHALTAALVLVATLPAGAQESPAKITQRFEFYASVDHEAEKEETQKFCVDPQYRIVAPRYRVTARNGDETAVRRMSVSDAEANCLIVTAFVKGRGVRKIGGLVVDRLGRGLLGLEIDVDATRVSAPGRLLQSPRGGEIQRVPEVQAPRGQDVQAPRGQDVQAPRGQDVPAPRGQDAPAPRSPSAPMPVNPGTRIPGVPDPAAR